MATEYTVRSFSDIVTAVFEDARQDLDDEELVAKVKRKINARYLQVQAYRKWRWRKTTRPLKIFARYAGTSVLVTSNSRTIVVSDNLTEEQANDWVGRKFYVTGKKEIYTILSLQSWTTSTADVTFILDAAYVGATASAQAFYVFQDEFGVWPDFEELDDVLSYYNRKEVRRVGPSKISEYFNRNPFMTGKARVISTVGVKYYEGEKLDEFVLDEDFMGRDESKRVRVYPGISLEDYILPITMIRKAQLLVEDDDEPLMSEEDRTILVDGGLASLYGILKDQAEVENFEARFTAKLEQMANDDQEDSDRPKLSPGFDYRGSSSGRGSDSFIYDFNEDDDDVITEI